MKTGILYLLFALTCFLTGCGSYAAVLQDSARAAQTDAYQDSQMILYMEHMRNNFRS